MAWIAFSIVMAIRQTAVWIVCSGSPGIGSLRGMPTARPA
jgi:hypothetical protein